MTINRKNHMLKRLLLFLIFLTLFSANAFAQADLSRIKLPPGFKIDVFAEGIENARSLELGAQGTIFVGTRTVGKVYAVLDNNHDYKADEVITLVQGLRSPNGVAFHEGDLYFAEINRVWKFTDIENHLHDKPKAGLISSQFPNDGGHGWKFIKFGPDGKLYVPVGMPCNTCLREDARYGSILRMNPDGSGLELFASGIRNTVGFDWHPQTKELWFTDNGRDNLGDDLPPDELNRAYKPRMHFGFPFCHGGKIPDPEFGRFYPCSKFEPPVQNLGPHVAALGMRFYTGTMFPEEYRNQIFIAEHGSWNRSSKIGYRVMLVKLDGDKAVSYEPFADGFHEGEAVFGRPVDVLVMPDGSLLVSDDEMGAIYRISYQTP